jgi:hypothetical protein
LPGGATDQGSVAMELSGGATDQGSVSTELPGAATHHDSVAMELPGGATDQGSVSTELPGAATHHCSVAMELPGGATDQGCGAMELPGGATDQGCGAMELPGGATDQGSGAMELPGGATDQAAVSMELPGGATAQGTVSMELPAVATDPTRRVCETPPPWLSPTRPLPELLVPWNHCSFLRSVFIVNTTRQRGRDIVPPSLDNGRVAGAHASAGRADRLRSAGMVAPALAALTGMEDGWKDAYVKALPSAATFAQRLPLVRVVVPHRGPRNRVETDDVLRDGRILPGHKSDHARDLDRRLGAADGVYFHAGRTHPVYGKVALVLRPLDEEDRAEVTPFGLGGLLCTKPEGAEHPQPPECVRPVSHLAEPEQAAFVQSSTWRGAGWRDPAAQFLAAYFGTDLGGYFALDDTGRPALVDPAEIFHPHTGSRDWRAWTFEVRIAAEILLAPILNSGRVMIWAMEDELYNELIQRRATPGEPPWWLSELMASRVPRIHLPDASFEEVLRAVDEEVKKACLT